MAQKKLRLSRQAGRKFYYNYAAALGTAKSNYKQAIGYYNTQKQLFLNMLKEANIEAGKLNQDEILKQFSNEIEQEFLAEDFGKLTQQFYSKIENMVDKFLNTDQGALLKQELNSLKQEYETIDISSTKNINLLSQKIKAIIEKNLGEKQLKDIQRSISNIYKKLYGTTTANKAAQGAGYGMFRRVLIKELTGKQYQMTSSQQGGYTKRLSGYYAETAIANVLKKWANNSSLKVFEAGVSGGKADVVIGVGKLKDLKQKLENIEAFSANIQSDKIINNQLLNNNIFSIQSKSWGIPEDLVASRQNNYSKGFMSIGHHQALYNSLPVSSNTPSVLRGWYQNVRDISSRLMTAIGPSNVMYRLRGNEMIWTSALIESMIAKRYYLAFWFTHNRSAQRFEYPATTELAWQKVDNRKNYAKNS